MGAAAYKHVVLGLIFLKYVSDVFEEQYARLEAERAQGADPEDPDEYRALNNGEFCDRRGRVLFIDARTMGRMADRTHLELTDEDIARIVRTYHAWRRKSMAGDYKDTPGFCKSVTLEEIRRHDHVLTPGRYVGAAPRTDDGEPFEQTINRLVAQVRKQQAERSRLDAAIIANLKALGY